MRDPDALPTRGSPRWPLALCALLSLAAGCQVGVPFDLARDVQVDVAATDEVGMLFHLDLAEAGALQTSGHGPWRSITLDSADVTVTQVDTDAGLNEAKSVSGTLRLRPAGAAAGEADVVVGTFSGLSLKAGAVAHLEGTEAASALLLAAHEKDGRFQVALDCTLDDGHPAHVVLWLALHASAGYRSGP
jgi:hypothetical protein